MKFQKEFAELKEGGIDAGLSGRHVHLFNIAKGKRFEIGTDDYGNPTYAKHVKKLAVNGRVTVTTTKLLPIEVKILMDMKGEMK